MNIDDNTSLFDIMDQMILKLWPNQTNMYSDIKTKIFQRLNFSENDLRSFKFEWIYELEETYVKFQRIINNLLESDEIIGQRIFFKEKKDLYDFMKLDMLYAQLSPLLPRPLDFEDKKLDELSNLTEYINSLNRQIDTINDSFNEEELDQSVREYIKSNEDRIKNVERRLEALGTQGIQQGGGDNNDSFNKLNELISLVRDYHHNLYNKFYDKIYDNKENKRMTKSDSLEFELFKRQIRTKI